MFYVLKLFDLLKMKRKFLIKTGGKILVKNTQTVNLKRKFAF